MVMRPESAIRAVVRGTATISGRDGQPLAAIVTRPALLRRVSSVVVFSQAGLQNKAGVGNYFRWLADRLAEEGIAAVRFDPAGTGDSAPLAGQDTMPLEEHFRAIQGGSMKDDTVRVIDFVRRELEPDEIFLWGQCGGCVSAVLAAAEQPEPIAGLILLAPPVLLAQREEIVRDNDPVVTRKGYLRKLLRPASYLRFFSGRSDYALMWAMLGASARRLAGGLRDAVRWPHEAAPDHPLFNLAFLRGFEALMVRRIPILFLLAELDSETDEFEREFEHKVIARRPATRALCRVHRVSEADHSLLFDEARHASLAALLDWVRDVEDPLAGARSLGLELQGVPIRIRDDGLDDALRLARPLRRASSAWAEVEGGAGVARARRAE